MPNRSSKRPKREDANVTAFRVVQEATREDEDDVQPDATPEPEPPEKEPDPEKNPAAVALGRLGGKKGGKARAEKLSPERRKEIARKAAQARSEKEKGKP